MKTLVMLLIFNTTSGSFTSPYPVGPMTPSQCEATIKHIDHELSLERSWNATALREPYIMKCVEVPSD